MLKRLAWELESGEATNAISGLVKMGDYDVLQILTLNELGYAGETLERLKPMVNYKADFSAPEWGYLLDKYTAKSKLSSEEAKKNYISVIEKGYKMIATLEAIFDKGERAKKEKASKDEAQKPHNKKWYQ